MMNGRFRSALAILIGLAALHSGPSAFAIDPSIQKVFGRWGSPENALLGAPNTLAATEKWIIAGAPQSDEGATDSGAAQVFDAVKGAWVRKLVPATAVANLGFGQGVAISGDLGLIGAPDSSAATAGTVYVFNLKTGALVRTLTPNPGDGNPGDQFGCAVAVTGNLVLIGSRADTGTGGALQGSAYLFNLTTGAQLAKFTDSLGAANDYFGENVAVEGNIGIVSSSHSSGDTGVIVVYDLTTFAQIQRVVPSGAVAGSSAGQRLALSGGKVFASADGNPNPGRVFVYDLISGDQRVLQPNDTAAADRFGYTLAASQGLLLVGKDTGGGKVYAFDLNSSGTTEMKSLSRPDPDGTGFGDALSLVGNTAVIASSYDDAQDENSGALYIYKPITRPMPLTKVTAKGDYAPGAADISFNTFGSVIQNFDGEIAFTSSLIGPGSGKGKDVGVWDTLGVGHKLDLLAKSRDSVGPTIASVSGVLNNHRDRSVYQAKLMNPAPNDQAIFVDNGSAVTITRWSAQIESAFPAVLPNGPGALPSKFLRVVQGRSPITGYLSTICTLRLVVNGVTATDDSGLLIRNLIAASDNAEREGTLAGNTGLTYGQFTDQLAHFSNHAAYTTAVVGPTATNQAIFVKNGFSAPKLAAQKGDFVTDGTGNGVPGVTFSSFNGVSADDSGTVLFRAVVTGTGVTPANNEGLWTYVFANDSKRQILRKGVDLGVNGPGFVGQPALAGVKIAKFLAFWQTFGQQIMLVQLTGTGVTKANDQALILFQQSDVADLPLVLLREGDLAPGCPGATIGTINRVDVSPYWGQYVVLATLTGAAKGTELALFRGASAKVVTPSSQVLRCPVLVLRKGFLFDNQPSKVKSISLPTNLLPASGAGTSGLGSVIQEANGLTEARNIALIIDFENGVRQIMNGTP